MASSSSQEEEEKKNIGKKNAKKVGRLPFLSHFYIWNETFLLH
jgi:hypothetical protein